MDRNIDFSNAPLLQSEYKKNLLEDYDEKILKLQHPEVFSLFTVTKVKKVNNSQLWGMYLLKKEELSKTDDLSRVKTLTLYHATSPIHADSIARNNIDWRRTTRTRFGIGACFSPSPKYAHDKSSSDGALIVYKVLVKNVEKTGVDYNLKIPKNVKSDTTSGNNGNVYVKYDDYSFYPEFIIYYNYTSKERSSRWRSSYFY